MHRGAISGNFAINGCIRPGPRLVGVANWPGMRPRDREKWPMIAATALPGLRPARSEVNGAAEMKAPKLVDGSISRMLTPAANILRSTIGFEQAEVRPTLHR